MRMRMMMRERGMGRRSEGKRREEEQAGRGDVTRS